MMWRKGGQFMRSYGKRITGIILALAMILTMMPAMVWAETSDTLTIDVADVIANGTPKGMVTENYACEGLCGDEFVFTFKAPEGTKKVGFTSTGGYYSWSSVDMLLSASEIYKGCDFAAVETVMNDLEMQDSETYSADDTAAFIVWDEGYEHSAVILVKFEGGLPDKSAAGGDEPEDTPLEAPVFKAFLGDEQISDDSITLVEDGYTGVGNYVLGEVPVDLYRIKIPEGTETIKLTFDRGCLAYEYKDSNNYVGPWYENDVLCGSGITEFEVPVDRDKDGKSCFVQVQEVYAPDYSGGDLRYAITFDIETKTSRYIKSSMKNVFGEEWQAVDLIRDGKKVSKDYFDALIKEISEQGDNLSSRPGGWYTDYFKAIIALAAGGYDPSDVDGYNLLLKTADYEATCDGGWVQGVSGPVYALLALDTMGYEIPEAPEGKVQATREKYISSILSSNRAEEGGWKDAWTKKVDVDITASAIVALAPYYNSDPEVKSAVDDAVDYLSTTIDKDGRIVGSYGPNSNSTAVTIWALCALGIDPAGDPRFSNNGKTIVDGLYSYMLDDGSFGYQDNTTTNLMSTQQCYEAMIAIDRLNSGKCSFYNFASDDHKWVHKEVKATCTKSGYEADVCASCGAEKSGTHQSTSALGHKYEHKKVAAKIGIAGKTYDKCRVCGKVANTKIIAALKPAAPSITKLSGTRKAFTAKWSKKSYTGYEMRYSRYSSMKSPKTLRFTSSKTVSKKVTRLKAKKRYYVQVRSYKTVNGKRVYSNWSAKKSVKTK